MQISGGNKLEAALAKMAKNLENASSVSIGFLTDSTYPSGESVAKIAALNEFGHENVPPRPFFRGMINDKSSEWPDAVGDLLVANKFDAKRTLAQTGQAIEGQLKEAISVYVGPPLAQSTIDRKGNDKQLIDSGTMWRAVSSRVD